MPKESILDPIRLTLTQLQHQSNSPRNHLDLSVYFTSPHIKRGPENHPALQPFVPNIDPFRVNDLGQKSDDAADMIEMTRAQEYGQPNTTSRQDRETKETDYINLVDGSKRIWRRQARQFGIDLRPDSAPLKAGDKTVVRAHDQVLQWETVGFPDPKKFDTEVAPVLEIVWNPHPSGVYPIYETGHDYALELENMGGYGPLVNWEFVKNQLKGAIYRTLWKPQDARYLIQMTGARLETTLRLLLGIDKIVDQQGKPIALNNLAKLDDILQQFPHISQISLDLADILRNLTHGSTVPLTRDDLYYFDFSDDEYFWGEQGRLFMHFLSQHYLKPVSDSQSRIIAAMSPTDVFQPQEDNNEIQPESIRIPVQFPPVPDPTNSRSEYRLYYVVVPGRHAKQRQFHRLDTYEIETPDKYSLQLIQIKK